MKAKIIYISELCKILKIDETRFYLVNYKNKKMTGYYNKYFIEKFLKEIKE
jgi:phage antirepressor YoqD-like protein